MDDDLQSPENGSLRISFTHDFGVNEHKCIEIEESMLEDLERGTLEIRGFEDDEAIFVTSNQTYKMRRAEFTNSQLLMLPVAEDKENLGFCPSPFHGNNSCDNKRSVGGMVLCHYILNKHPPRTNVLKDLLMSNPYKRRGENDMDVDEIEEKMSSTDTSLESLKHKVQASDEELLQGLDEVNAIEVNGQWKLLTDDYVSECFNDILSCIIDKQWSFDHIDANQLIQNVTNHEPKIVDHCFKMHTREHGHSQSDIYSLDPSKVCLFVAKRLVIEANGAMEENAFMQEWKDTIPYGIDCDVSMLNGSLIRSDKGNLTYWELFEERELSPDPKHRFEQLFAKKNVWGKSDIEPYLTSLVRSGHNMERLLLKHTRVLRVAGSTGDAATLYTSRHAKRM